MSADGHFRVTLSLRKEPVAGPIYCKMETSARFRQLKTVKLSCDALYRVDISFKPPQILQSLSVSGKPIEATEKARDGTACAYSAYYSTKGVQPNAHGHREDFPITMRVVGSGYLTTCLQVKYYRFNDQNHCEWGARLHCIELDCSSVQGRLVTVDRETYRNLGLESS